MAGTDKLVLTLSKNNMKVKADYLPSSEGEKIKPEDILEKLDSMGVKVGIKKDVIGKICESSRSMKSVLVAEAIPPQVGEAARIENYVDLTRPVAIEREDGSVDFKNLGEVPFAKVGQELYRKIPPAPGKPGSDVLGGEIPGLLGRDLKLVVGRGVEIDSNDPNLVRAAANGELLYQNGTINVLEVHHVNSDINFETGNINFKGSVVISGTVQAGFEVRADGDIRIMKGVEDAEVIGGNDIVIMGGCTGTGKGLISAARDVYVKFATNQNIKADRDIIINGNSHHATLTAGRSVNVHGYKSTITGGNCEARLSVEASYFGSTACPHTIIKVGFDHELIERLKIVKEEIEELEESKKKLEKSIDFLNKLKYEGNSKLPPDKIQILNKLQRAQVSVSQKLNSLGEELNSLLERKQELDKAFAIANLGVFPKVQVHIGNQWITNEDIIGPSRFKIVDGDVFRLSK